MKSIILLVLFAAAGLAQSLSSAPAALSAVGATTTIDAHGLAPQIHTVQITVTGSPTTCSVRLEGSIDKSTWFDLSGSQDCTGGNIMFHVANKPMLYLRGYAAGLAGGSSPTIAFRYLGVR